MTGKIVGTYGPYLLMPLRAEEGGVAHAGLFARCYQIDKAEEHARRKGWVTVACLGVGKVTGEFGADHVTCLECLGTRNYGGFS